MLAARGIWRDASTTVLSTIQPSSETYSGAAVPDARNCFRNAVTVGRERSYGDGTTWVTYRPAVHAPSKGAMAAALDRLVA